MLPLLKITIPPVLVNLYGPDNPNRAWIIVMTVCVVMCLPRATRRMGAIGFVVVFIAMFIWNFLNNTYKQMTPQEEPTNKSIRRNNSYQRRL
jgi:uncharacterized membrane protein